MESAGDNFRARFLTMSLSLPASRLRIVRGYPCGGRKAQGRETPAREFGIVTKKVDGEIGTEIWTELLTGRSGHYI